MRTLLRCLIAVSLAVTLSGCFKYAIKVGEGGNTHKKTADKTGWSHHFLWGLIGDKEEIDVKATCPSGNATVTIETTFLDGFISSCLTSPIWYPSTVSIFCDDGVKKSVELSPEQVREMAASDAFLDVVAEEDPERLEAAKEAHRVANGE